MTLDTYPFSSVLLVTFNRPDYTRQVLDRLRECKVPKLYIFNDGPRENNPNDREARNRIRELLAGINWDCELKTLFSENNLGCGLGVSSAITWAFTNEDRLIILEDDCVPSPAFFPYCNNLLERYREDTRIWLISGENHDYPPEAFKDGDYIFSQFGFNCGWATWRRCWDHLDMSMACLEEFLEGGHLRDVFCQREIVKGYYKRYSRLKEQMGDKPRFWTAQFGFQVVSNRGYFIIPRENLIENIGEVGDHTVRASKYNYVKSSDDFMVCRHPRFVLPDYGVDLKHFKARIKPRIQGKPLGARILNKVSKIVRGICKLPV